MADFLLEIGCEEIPARMIDDASEQLRQRVSDLVQRERLSGSGFLTFTTPRRLAIIASGVAAQQADITEQITGPSVNIAFKNGDPTPAAHAFAKKTGVSVEQLQRTTTAKGEYVTAMVTKRGKSAAEIFSSALPAEIASIYWPKSMYWRKSTEKFVRPVRWLVAMLDSDVVPLEFAGIKASDESRGHRILANHAVRVAHAGKPYIEALHNAKVLNQEDREKQTRKALDSATRSIQGARWREDKALLDTVVNLTEWPSVVLGNFDPEFLQLAEEVLVTVMRDHQKYFAMEGGDGRLLPHFLAVLNTDGDHEGTIRHGHERVLRARFNDARFFWQTDQKHPLRERTLWLKNVTFQKDLGSYYEKTLRVQRLCSWISESIRQSGVAIRPGVVHKAAHLAKADLTTELVKEFTELQGIIGGLYARVQELDADMPDSTRQLIAQAIYEHYKPESMEDSVPSTTEGAVLSIADKADSIAGMFSLGMVPSGSKDPFALRRQANGIVKILAEHNLPLTVTQLMKDARTAYQGTPAEHRFKNNLPYSETVHQFFRERIEFYLRDVKGYRYDVVNAVLAAEDNDLVDAIARAQAVTDVRPSDDFRSISIALKRIKNILRQAEETGKQVAADMDPSLFDQPAERELALRIPATMAAVQSLRSEKNYTQALIEISTLRPLVDAFFDKVMVMVDDERIRANRLRLLQTLLKEFSTIADFSEIVTEG